MISILHRNDEEDLRETESRRRSLDPIKIPVFRKTKIHETFFVSASLDNAYVLKESGKKSFSRIRKDGGLL